MINFRPRHDRYEHEGGYLLIYVTIVVFALTAIAFTIAVVTGAKYTSSKRVTYTENALSAAEAGVSVSIKILNDNSSYPTPIVGTLYDDASGSRGKATYTVTISNGSVPNTKVIVSSGKAYRPGDTAEIVERKVRVVAEQQKSPVTGISLMAGAGGLRMDSFSRVTTGGGSLYVLGNVQTNWAANSSIGTAAKPLSLTVANIACGAANWPERCAPTSDSIYGTSGFNGAIYGTVCANDNVSGTDIFASPPDYVGRIANCSPPRAIMPSFDKKAFIDRIKSATTKRTAASFNCPFSFTKQYVDIPANSWIEGDLEPSGSGGCVFRIKGDVYLDGNLTVKNWGAIVVDNSVGATRPTIVINGKVTTADSAGFVSAPERDIGFGPNNVGTVADIISFQSTNVACSKSEDIPSSTVSTCLTIAEAKASADLGGSASNRALVCAGSGNAVNFLGATFYAYYGTISCAHPFKVQSVGGQGIRAGFTADLTLLDTTGRAFGSGFWWREYKATQYQQLY